MLTENETIAIVDSVEKQMSLWDLRTLGAENKGNYLDKNPWRKLAKESGITLPERICRKLSPIEFGRKKSETGERYEVSSPNPLQVHSTLLYNDGFETDITRVSEDYSLDASRVNGVDVLPDGFRSSVRKSTRIAAFEEESFLTYSNCISRAEKMADYCETCRLKYARYQADKYRMGLCEFDRSNGGHAVTYLVTFTIADAYKSGFETGDGSWIMDYRLLSARLTREVFAPLRKQLRKYGVDIIYMFCREIGSKGRLHFHCALTLSRRLYGYCARRKVDPVTEFNTKEIVVPTARDFYDSTLKYTGWSECEFADDTPRVARKSNARLKKVVFDTTAMCWISKPIGNSETNWTWDEWTLAYILYGHWRFGVIDVQECADKYASSAYVVKYVLKDGFMTDGKPQVTFSRGILTPVFEKYKDKLQHAESVRDLAIPTGYYEGKETFAYSFPQYYRERYISYSFRRSQTDDKIISKLLRND